MLRRERSYRGFIPSSPRALDGLRCASGPGATWLGFWGRWIAGRAGRWPGRSARGGPTARSGCLTRRAGTPMRCATTCETTWSSTWVIGPGCWCSSRRASRRRARTLQA